MRRSPSSSPSLDRVAAWREDLHVFATELPQRHNNALFHVDETTWRRSVADVDTNSSISMTRT